MPRVGTFFVCMGVRLICVGNSLSGWMSLAKNCTDLNRASRSTVYMCTHTLSRCLCLQYFISARHGWCPGPTQRARSQVNSFTHKHCTSILTIGLFLQLFRLHLRLSERKEQAPTWNLLSKNGIGGIMTPVRYGKAERGGSIEVWRKGEKNIPGAKNVEGGVTKNRYGGGMRKD